MSGFGAIGGMNTMLRNNVKLLRNRKPLEGLKNCIESSNIPLIYKIPTKEYILKLKRNLKNEKIKNYWKNAISLFITFIILGIVFHYLQII